VEITLVEGPTAPDPNTSLADRELVSQVLRRLDDRDRAVIVLHYYVGLPLTDVAVALGAPIGTVKSRLHRALGEMRTGILAEMPLPQTPAARWTAS
jgi:RNA polymerase sigma factor (sigma-70 family)